METFISDVSIFKNRLFIKIIFYKIKWIFIKIKKPDIILFVKCLVSIRFLKINM